MKLIIQDVKEELKSIRSEVSDLKVSLQFMQAKAHDCDKQMSLLQKDLAVHSVNLDAIHNQTDHVESQ